MDFTLKSYKNLLNKIRLEGFEFQTFSEFLTSPKDKVVILRHDVDLLPQNSLNFAKIQSEMKITGTYYFRAVSESWDERIIKEIHSLGHEIGYHYENLTTCNGDLSAAIKDFSENLKRLREIVPVSTICMHGSPMSKYDSKDLWKENDYKEYNLIGEPYFDVDFNKVFYLTDTGRKWNGSKSSVRDKVISDFEQSYRSTKNIIQALNNSELPNQVMFTFHPQRWTNNLLLWIKELMFQSLKNQIKKYYVKKNN